MADTNPSPVDKVFRENLQRLRDERNLTQQDVAVQMRTRGHGWHQPTVYKVETGLRRVFLAEALALAEILRVDLDTLLGARVVEAV
ncbi:hypothetical protein ALI144C_44995 [Actinosynnema sp. ALI-1.44]|uniref:helix-turn-helix domain-containing protein n=1 Tax=Actinosynnema sp. ALI-1.44 TaxID=1933779 RepID=UPI00097C2A3B|nr:helix-turn-helix transcriptional regulator [Actinosynnema sp. ALI-1.44]ONI73110.1 hypothetical protein ALI144C_44995 [Actinosynnema sp. ALI-1.44]